MFAFLLACASRLTLAPGRFARGAVKIDLRRPFTLSVGLSGQRLACQLRSSTALVTATDVRCVRVSLPRFASWCRRGARGSAFSFPISPLVVAMLRGLRDAWRGAQLLVRQRRAARASPPVARPSSAAGGSSSSAVGGGGLPAELSKLSADQLQARIDKLRASLIVAQQTAYQEQLNRVAEAATVAAEAHKPGQLDTPGGVRAGAPSSVSSVPRSAMGVCDAPAHSPSLALLHSLCPPV